MGKGVKPPGNKGRYKNITGGGFAQPRTPADQEHHHHTTNNITPRTSPQLRPHHHHELSNREDLHHQHTIKSTKPAKPKTNMVT
jgi:hypothetical protein